MRSLVVLSSCLSSRKVTSAQLSPRQSSPCFSVICLTAGILGGVIGLLGLAASHLVVWPTALGTYSLWPELGEKSLKTERLCS